MKHLGFIKTFMFGLVGLVLCLMGCNHNPKSEEHPTKITITIDGDNLKAGKGDKIEVDKGSTWLNVKNNVKITGVKFNDDYTLEMWKLDSATGDALTDVYAFQENKTVFATSKSIFKTNYDEDDDILSIVGYTCEKEELPENLVIPNMLEEKPVKAIGEEAFKACSKIKTLNLSKCETLLLISVSAFEECENLENVILPASIMAINTNVFKNCKKLTAVDFSKCTSLSNLSGFTECEGLTSLDLSNCTALESIEYEAFTDCINISGNVKLPDNLKEITFNSFRGCNKIEKIDLSNCKTLTLIDDKIFYGCTACTITLPVTITKIGQRAFGENEHLVKNIRIPNGAEGDKVKELVTKAPSNYPLDRIQRF